MFARVETFLLPIFGGLLVAAGMPGWRSGYASILGMAMLISALQNSSVKKRGLQGFLFGVFWLAPSTFWMIDLTPPGYVIQVLLFSAMYGLAMMCLPRGEKFYFAVPLVFVAVAAIRWNWPFGGVPLATIAHTQADTAVGQTARLFGSLGLVGFSAFIAIVLYLLMKLRDEWVRERNEAFRANKLSSTARPEAQSRTKPHSEAEMPTSTGLHSEAQPQPTTHSKSSKKLTALLAAIAFGVVVIAHIAPDGNLNKTLTLDVVQGGGPQNTRAIYTSARDVFDRHMTASEQIRDDVDLVLWPEDVAHSAGDFTKSQEFVELQGLAAEKQAPIIAGIIEGFSSEGFFLNASIVITEDGQVMSRYDKLRRVPFGEYVPARALIKRFAPAYLPSRDAKAGTGPGVIDTPVGRLAIAISWEIFHDDRPRSGVEEGGELIINPTNGSSYWLTILQEQQVASSALRAIENGRWVAQAAPTGFSAVIDQRGRVLERTEISEAAVLHHTVEMRTGSTWANQHGFLLLMLVVGGLFLFAFFDLWRDKPNLAAS